MRWAWSSRSCQLLTIYSSSIDSQFRVGLLESEKELAMANCIAINLIKAPKRTQASVMGGQ
jgi:hypothetical protein